MLSFIRRRLTKLRALPIGEMLAFAAREPEGTWEAERRRGPREYMLESRSPASLEETLKRRFSGSSRIEPTQQTLVVRNIIALHGKPCGKRVPYPTELDLRCLRLGGLP